MSGDGPVDPPIRVVVADDHPVYREGLVSALADRGIEVVAEAADGTQAVEAACRHEPDVVLMDLSMPGTGGIEAITHLQVQRPGTPILVLTMSEDDESLFAALRAGARGYLLKGARGDDIARAVVTVFGGEMVVGAALSGRLVAALTDRKGGAQPPPFRQLTDREREILELVARGYDNHRIARHLVLSEKTVRNHVSLVLAKLPATTRAEAVALARDAGLGTTPER